MNGWWSALRMTLGGIVCGSFLGMFAGGILVALAGALWGDFSLGLDGALVGGGVGCLSGALLGALLAARDSAQCPATSVRTTGTTVPESPPQPARSGVGREAMDSPRKEKATEQLTEEVANRTG